VQNNKSPGGYDNSSAKDFCCFNIQLRCFVGVQNNKSPGGYDNSSAKNFCCFNIQLRRFVRVQNNESLDVYDKGIYFPGDIDCYE
jgi:hypothetical protein